MIDWRRLDEASRADALLPEVIGERCVHSMMESASCRACAEACPRDAWVIRDELLGIDMERCDGCDLCVAACTEGAIRGRFAPAIRSWKGESTAFAACEQAAVATRDAGLMPCLHSLGLEELLRLRERGVRSLLTTQGSCSQCPRGSTRSPLSARIRDLNRVYSSRMMEPLAHRNLDGDTWLKAWEDTQPAVEDQGCGGRRAFFRALLEGPRAKAQDLLQDEETGLVPPGTRLAERGPGDLYFHVPVMDPTRCTGCDACTRLCPHGALSLDAKEAGLAYRIDARLCTGCRICVDLCEDRALSIRPMASSAGERIPLKSRRCRACGAPYHDPSRVSEEADLCGICAKANHLALLHQVLD